MALGLQRHEVAAGDHGRVAARAAQDLEHHRGGRGLAARARDGHRTRRRDPVREHLGAMHDGQLSRLGRRDVGHGVLDRGRDDERAAVVAEAAAILRPHAHAEPFKLRSRLGRSARSKPRSLPLARPPRIAWNCASALMPLPPTPA
jgi:hypothetical protein